ncbi:hypothetical protein RJ640_013562 [Escallonia rubra]|uniref:Uncharacterized protein n=1 Tax=Escallonia rubra TaxID=112253 RepID=A0AA88UCQ9_9ASTE|nr:hypothetical protein RJ640_013562 [Escallonia rubra]
MMLKEALLNPTQKGGFRTLPFIIVNEAFEKVASFGLMPNMIIYLMSEYHLDMATGSNVLFLWSAATNFLPVLGAFLADSLLGRFKLIGFGSIVSLLLLNVEVKIDEEDLAIILFSSLPSAYETLRTTLLFGKDMLTVDEVTTTLLETDSLKDSGGGSHPDGLVARADPKSDSRCNKNWQ